MCVDQCHFKVIATVLVCNESKQASCNHGYPVGRATQTLQQNQMWQKFLAKYLDTDIVNITNNT